MKNTKMALFCKSTKCPNPVSEAGMFCYSCHLHINAAAKLRSDSLADKYPKYYKSTNGLAEVDVYAVHKLFNIQDPSGAIQHASKKLLLSGVRTGGKSAFDDIREARDTLNRWMELNPQTK